MDTSEQPPIACCLSTGEYQRRNAWIESLARTHLRKPTRDDLVLRLLYASEAADEVRRMVAQERLCCAFLTFDFDPRPDAVHVTITAPETAREAADTLFGQFLKGRNVS